MKAANALALSPDAEPYLHPKVSMDVFISFSDELEVQG
jgi:hypothetical protein